MQVELQPSLGATLKSSQPSEEVQIPSPHKLEQVFGVVIDPPVQVYPEAGPVQSDLQFVSPFVSSSSHASPGMFFPSPQMAEQEEGETKLLQT